MKQKTRSKAKKEAMKWIVYSMMDINENNISECIRSLEWSLEALEGLE